MAVIGLLALVAACGSPSAARPAPTVVSALSDFGPAPEFRLVDQSGSPFGTAEVAGRVALVDFVYTHCTDACPILSANMAVVQRHLKEEGLFGSQVVLLSMSVDPLHDTPEALHEYGQRFGADAEGWKLLTGDWDDVYEAISGFKVQARAPRPPADAPAPGGTEIAHTQRVVLVDRVGQVRAFYRGQETPAEEMLAGIRQVLK